MGFRYLAMLLVCTTIAIACKKQPPLPPDTFTLPAGRGAFIVNEGNFMWSNASLDYWDFERDTLYSGLYQAIHNSLLGDVLQSAYLDGNTIWLVVNNSGKVIGVELETMAIKAVISGLPSPRYVAATMDYVFISDLYEPALSIYSKNADTMIGTLPMHGWTEELLLVNDEIWIANTAGDYLAVIDANSASLVDTLYTQHGPRYLEIDQNGMVWVLCAGNNTTPAALQAFIPGNPTPQVSLLFAQGATPAHLAINASGDQLYYTLDKAIYTLSISATTLPTQPLVATQTQALYGMEVDPYGLGIWVMDALTYDQPGTITQYSLQGDSLRTITVGLIPNSMAFR